MHRRIHTIAVFLTLACGLLLPSLVHAQATGQITGLITDPSGAVVPDATVEVVNEATGQKRTVNSRDDGFYLVPLVNPGIYQVKASKSGFGALTRNGNEVAVNGTTRVDFSLQVGQVAEQVIATATAPLVETSNATLGVVVDQQKVVDLPLNGRNFAQLGTLLPGVVAPPAAPRRIERHRHRRRLRRYHRQLQRQRNAKSIQQFPAGWRLQQRLIQ